MATDDPAHNPPVGGGGGVSAHSALTGLTTGDDHTQYALLAGRAGGQSVSGDTASGGSLTLDSTAHATKGSVVVASDMSVTRSAAGATVQGAIRNTSNTASAKAKQLIEVAGTTADDAFTHWSISGTSDYVAGIDNSDADIFKIQSGSAVATGVAGFFILNASGIVGAGTEKPVSASGQFFQVRASSSNPTSGVAEWILNSNSAGASILGLCTANNTSTRLVNMGSTAAGASFGVNNNTGLGLLDNNGPIAVGTTNSNQVVIGTNATARATALAAGGWQYSTGIVESSRTVSDANATITIADTAVTWTTTLTADRTCTLPNAAAVSDGFIVRLYVTLVGAFKVTVSGDVNIMGAANYLLDTDYESVVLQKTGSLWRAS